ncbi:hypothetical protein GGR56DRAFT_326750 [Xylariaceae sp. FL0804]|nr:hypothetical protein GGR56DRAFT_326750 [Xylariaceae sp. FL0804]
MVGMDSRWSIRRLAICAVAFSTSGVLADQILATSGFTNCDSDSDIVVNNVNIKYNNNDKTVTFDVSGTSTKEQNVSAVLAVTAYGQDVYTNKFKPCDESTYVEQLCPVPSGTFSASGTQNIPDSYANSIPSIAFQVPDIDAQATLKLTDLDTGASLGCVQSQVSNGKTTDVPAVSYIAAGLAAGALLLTGASAIGGALSGSASGGAGTMSPSFTEVMGVFQGFAVNGMQSVELPQVYRSFSKNFAFSTGLIPWTQMQKSIDSFRASTGGNLTDASVEYLQNATLVFPDGSTSSANGSTFKRALDHWVSLATRDINVSADNSTSTNATSSSSKTFQEAAAGIKAFAEELSVPQENTFMTVLLIVAIIIGVIIVGILLVKVVLEAWALFGSFPKGLTGFRKHYWRSIARTITSLILLLYSVWVLYCIFQFTHGDSWAAQALAGVSLAIFTGVLAFFSWKIYVTAKKLKSTEGDASALYEDKSFWLKYSLFYESYKKSYWWLFVPAIVYMFAKGAVLAATDGDGMTQGIALLIVEGLMLCLLLWSRPYERKKGNVINILISVTRVLSAACVLVFVGEFGIAETTQTIAGVVLIAIQAALAGLLGILIIWNAVISLCKQNPHRKRRKEMEKMQRDMDTLTPLDARNSLLKMERTESNDSNTFSMAKVNTDAKQPLSQVREEQDSLYEPYRGAAAEPANPYTPLNAPTFNNRPLTPVGGGDSSHDRLMDHAAPIDRQPTLPNVGGTGYQGGYGQGNAPYRY